MTDQPVLPSDGFIEATSKKGKPYRADKDNASDGEKGEHKPALMGKHDFTLAVNWPVTTDWVPTSSEVQQIAGITRYKLLYEPRPEPPPGEKPPPIWFNYHLWFTNTEHYDYYFSDKSDHYENNTYINRDHYVDYNSDDPTIVSITGV